jgi:hypothetical protein
VILPPRMGEGAQAIQVREALPRGCSTMSSDAKSRLWPFGSPGPGTSASPVRVAFAIPLA